MAWVKRSQKEKRIHYTQVAKGEKPVKANSRFSEAEQRAYARGQRDARNESARICKYKNSTELERAAYREKRKADRAAWNAKKNKSKKRTKKAV